MSDLEYQRIQIICRECRGTGKKIYNTENPAEEICTSCSGTGYAEWGRLITKEIEEE